MTGQEPTVADHVSDNIYSPENIERSRARARGIRAMVDAGDLGREWLDTAVEVERYADEREAKAPAPIKAELCGFAIGDKTGACVFTPHRPGTPHSWAPDINPGYHLGLVPDGCPECGATGAHRPRCSRPVRWGDCDGGHGCSVSVHEHGCHSDRGTCNHPEEHQEPIASQTPGPPRMNGSTAIASGNVPGPTLTSTDPGNVEP